MHIKAIKADLEAIEANTALFEEANFDARADAIDFIDFHIVGRIEGLQGAETTKELDLLMQRAEKVTDELADTNHSLFKRLREDIRAGVFTYLSFRKIVAKYVRIKINDAMKSGVVGYDNLDLFINGLLCGEAIPDPALAMEPEMVFYQQTPARIVFEMAMQARLTQSDVFFDIGSGLGQVAILVNLLTGATAKGIEYEPAYCIYAKACARDLNLCGVEFINANARNADYSEGTVFFLYTPFEGNMLQQMLEILQQEAQKKQIRVFTYGPCSATVSRQNWLSCVVGDADDFYKLCEFLS